MINFSPRRSSRLLSLCAGIFSLLGSTTASAQTYCAPAVTQTSFYISEMQFNYSGPGLVYSTGSSGYSATTGSSSKTVPRFYSASIWYGITNTSSSAVTVYLQWFADWNHDGDFSDVNEVGNAGSVNIGGNNATYTGTSWPPALNSLTGTTRIRFIASLTNGITDPCAAVTGEVEDYTITITNSTAPVLSASTGVFLNNQLATQTATDGFTINQLVTGSTTTAALITDPDDSTSSYVPRGMAITGTSGNGTWEYKTGTGSWAPIGSVSATNALLLLGDCGDSRYKPNNKLRFVPSATGTPGLTFNAWDGTTGNDGGYGNTTVNGGNTAYSTGSRTITMPVVTASPARHFYLASAIADNILSSSFDPAGGQAYTPSAIVAANASLTNVTDMEFDATNNRLLWTESGTADKIVSSSPDGTTVATVYALPNTGSLPNGIATGGSKIFYTDNSVALKGLYSISTSGTNNTQITGGAGQLATPNQVRDIEYFNGKLYLVSRATTSSNWSITQMDTTGANPVEIASSANQIQYLAVAAGTVYWTEVVSVSGVNTGSLYSRSIAGGAVNTLVTTSGHNFRDVKVDVANNKVYYLDFSAASNLPVDRSLFSVPLAGGAATKVLNLPENYIVMAWDNNQTPLAISLIDFTGIAMPQANHLQWSVGHEGQGATYTVERSADAKAFTTLGAIAGQAISKYQFDDVDAPSGAVYYRLHLKDAEGADQYSNTIRIDRPVATDGNISVYPNPTEDELYVSGTTPEQLDLFNILGQKIATVTGASTISLKALPAGNYSLRITLSGNMGLVYRKIVRK